MRNPDFLLPFQLATPLDLKYYACFYISFINSIVYLIYSKETFFILTCNFLWVTGFLNGYGYSSELLNMCIEDSKKKGMDGICILSTKKKTSYLADPKFLAYKGFKVCDEANNGIQLWYLSFKDSVSPKFKSCAKDCHIDELGFVLYYTNQCPFNAKYVPVIENVSKDLNIAFKAIHLDTKEKAQNAPTPITTYALFYNGEYVTNDVMNEKKFIKLLSNLGL